jgi:2-phosphoglycolate phosphatase
MLRILRPFDPRTIRLLIFDLDGTLIDSRLDLIHSVNATLRHIGRPELDDDVIASYVGDGAPALVRRALGGTDLWAPDLATKELSPKEIPAAKYEATEFEKTKLEATTPETTKREATEIAATELQATEVSELAAPRPETTDANEDARNAALLPEALEFFLGYYRVHKLDHTTVYQGIPEMLAELAQPANGKQTSAVTRQMAVLTNKPVRPARDILQALGLAHFFTRIYGGNSFTTKKPDPLGVRTILEETGVPPEEALMIGDSPVDVQTGRNASLWTCGALYGFAPHSLQNSHPDALIEKPRELEELLL